MKKKFSSTIIVVLMVINLLGIKVDASVTNNGLSDKEVKEEYLEIVNKYEKIDSSNFMIENEKDIKVNYEIKEGLVPIVAWEEKEILIHEVVDKIGKPIEEVTYADIAEIKMLDLSMFILGITFEGELPEILKEFKTLRILNLNGALITKLPDWFYSLTQLRELDLSATKISEISASIKNLEELTTLDISGTGIAKIPVEITSLENLESIRLGNMPFEEKNQIPKEIFDIKNLRSLSFTETGLEELPEDIKKLTKLEYVNFAFNKFSKFPEEIYELKNLQVVNFYSNYINSIDERISELKNLNGLILSNNRLTKLPESLKYIKGDSRLSIDVRNNFLAYEPILGDRQSIDLCGNFIDCTLHYENSLEEMGEDQFKEYRQLNFEKNIIYINSGEETTNAKIKELANVIRMSTHRNILYKSYFTPSEVNLKFELLDSNDNIIELKNTKDLPIGKNELRIKLVGANIDNEKASSDFTIYVNESGDGNGPGGEEEEKPIEKPVEKPIEPTINKNSDKTPLNIQNVAVAKLPNTGGHDSRVVLVLGLLSTAGGVILLRKK